MRGMRFQRGTTRRSLKLQLHELATRIQTSGKVLDFKISSSVAIVVTVCDNSNNKSVSMILLTSIPFCTISMFMYVGKYRKMKNYFLSPEQHVGDTAQ